MFHLTQAFQTSCELAVALELNERLFVPATAVVITDDPRLELTPCD